MALHLEIKPSADSLGDFADGAIVKLNDLMALIANEVVMMAFVQKNVVRGPGSLVNRAYNPHFTQQF